MKKKIYNGSSKVLYQTDQDYTLIMGFTDQIILDDKNVYNIYGKGVVNNSISSFIMSKLDIIGIENHFIEKINMREQLIQAVDMLPIQSSITSIANGRYVTEFGVDHGYVFDNPIIEFRIKNRDLHYPVVNEHQILSFNWMNKHELDDCKNIITRINDFLTGLFIGLGIRIMECKLEFGRVFKNDENIFLLADEISLDNCKLLDMHSNKKLTVEFNNNTSDMVESYNEVLQRFNIINNI